ncbi:MAG TPA: hypothetical protein VF174_15795 [Micromonosporaceae bacterium]
MRTDLAIPDYAIEIEQAADPGAYVIQACERAKTWLAHALEHGGIDQIVEMKCQAEAIRVYTMSKQLGKDAQLSAAEIVRRAERGIGLAIRRGQEAGEIARNGERAFPVEKRSTSQFFIGGQEQSDTYAMTDGVSDDQFEAAIAEGRSDGNLSRANVIRKVRAKKEAAEARDAAMADEDEMVVPDPSDRTTWATLRRREVIRRMAAEGHTSKQIADRLGRSGEAVRTMVRAMGLEIPADAAMGRSARRLDPNRVIAETVHGLDGMAMGVRLILDDLDGLNVAEVRDWAASLTESIRVLNRLVKKMKEKAQ